MSTRALFHVLKWRLPPAQKLVAIFAGDQSNDDGVAFFSVARACAFTSLSERTVRSTLGALESAGKILRIAQSGRINRIEILFDAPVDKSVNNGLRGVQKLQGGVQKLQGGGANFAPHI